MNIPPDRKALVTGGASGIGLQIARRLAERGVDVAVGDVVLGGLSESDSAFLALELDVTDSGAVADFVNRCVEVFGGLDTVVNCAGVISVTPLEAVTDEDWRRIIDVNLTGAFFVSRAAAPALRSSGRGRIISITSGAGLRGYPWLQAYCASKFGLIGLSQSLAAELAPDQVTVNCVSPGACPFTGMGRDLTAWKAKLTGLSEEEVRAVVAASYPLGRYATEDDIASAVLYLVSDEASYATGITLDIAGGEHLGLISGATSRAGSGFEFEPAAAVTAPPTSHGEGKG